MKETTSSSNDFELEWDLLGEEWSILPIDNVPSFPLFDSDAILTGDVCDSSLTTFPKLVNLNTIPTEEAQLQTGRKRKFCQGAGDEPMLKKLLRSDSNSVIAVDQSKKSDTQPLKLLPPPNSVKPEAMAPAVKPKCTPTSTVTSSTCKVSSSTQTRDTKQSEFLKTFRQKNPRKFDASEKKLRTESYKEEPVLNEELQALMMLIECMQKDLKQTEVLVNFISDFIKKHCKRRVVFETV